MVSLSKKKCKFPLPSERGIGENYKNLSSEIGIRYTEIKVVKGYKARTSKCNAPSSPESKLKFGAIFHFCKTIDINIFLPFIINFLDNDFLMKIYLNLFVHSSGIKSLVNNKSLPY